MYVGVPYVCCPSCGTTFQTGSSIALSAEVPTTANPQSNGNGNHRLIFSSTNVLHSWKDISGYLGLAVRTLQRWEHDFGLPVHRPAERNHTAVLAFPEELDAWLLDRPVSSQPKATVPVIPIKRNRQVAV
jgi:hypothetical protein